MTTTTAIAAAGFDPTGAPEDPVTRPEHLARLEREWAEAASALTAWAIAADRDPSSPLDHEIGYRLAFRAMGTESRYLEAARRHQAGRGVLTTREARLRRDYDAARQDLKTIAVLGAGLGHAILAGCDLWRPIALVASNDPFEARMRNAALVRYRLTADAWRSHVGFSRAARRGTPPTPVIIRHPAHAGHGAGSGGVHQPVPHLHRRRDHRDRPVSGAGVHPVHAGTNHHVGRQPAEPLAVHPDRAEVGGVHPAPAPSRAQIGS